MLRWSRSIADRLRSLLARILREDGGSASLEFLTVGLLMLVPLIYVVVALGQIQHQALGAEAAARHVARAISLSSDAASAGSSAFEVQSAVMARVAAPVSAVIPSAARRRLSPCDATSTQAPEPQTSSVGPHPASTLPSTLHLQGLELVPCTLEVGDYILSPELCVERKALPDLIASFGSGRLHTQCTAMCRYYAIPILLIEFSGDKAFQLQGYDLGSDISIVATGSKKRSSRKPTTIITHALERGYVHNC